MSMQNENKLNILESKSMTFKKMIMIVKQKCKSCIMLTYNIKDV